MHKHPGITESRINQTAGRIQRHIYSDNIPLEVAAWHAPGEPVPAAEALAQKYEPFKVGEPWGGLWTTTWFRIRGKLPADWKEKNPVALVRIGRADRGQSGEGFTMEGLVWQDGKPVLAINVNRARVPVVPAKDGSFEFFVEAAANPHWTDEERWLHPETRSKHPWGIFTLEQADLACFSPEAYAFQLDFKVAYQTMLALESNPPGRNTLPPHAVTDPRRGELMAALNHACNVFDPDDASTIPAAREALREVLARKNADPVHTISAIGHAHIDTAWLWPLRETMRKCARTFSTALAYMKQYPEYVFGCSQPQQYLWMKNYYPEIWKGIKEAVARGQWEPIGSMWIEADCNLSSGESLIRQILHGKNFFMEEFGYETIDVWIPDVFGYSASMPQIMRKSGVRYFVTQKISWSQLNKFPHHTFLWEGIDGTQIFTHFPPADTYNASMEPGQIKYNERNFREHDRASRSLYVYGYGDGGGGPTIEMLEMARRCKDLSGLPRVDLEKVSTFLEKAEADARDLPVWVGELYLELHRGTYTTQAANKRGNRKSEFLLHDAEFFDVVAGPLAVNPVDAPRPVYDVAGQGDTVKAYLDRAWKLLLLNQFHDIIPGSSITWVYKDSSRDYANIAKLGNEIIRAGTAEIASKIDTADMKEPMLVVNTLNIPRTEVVSLPDGSPFHVRVPECGYTVVDASTEAPVTSYAAPVVVEERERLVALDNGIVRITLNRQGIIRSIRDHRVNRFVLAPGERGNLFQLFRDHPNAWDAWDVDIFAFEQCTTIDGFEKMEVVEQTPIRAGVRVVRRFGKSCIDQTIRIHAGSARIDFETKIDWQEDHKMLKVAFPVNVRSSRATYEIQYGHTERPTHFNTSWDVARFEVCAQKWVDLSEGDYGVALLNDCKYGHDVHGNTIRLSLLRAPESPDPLADRGTHEFTYSLLPHTGGPRTGGVICEAYALNVPLRVTPLAVQKGKLPRERSYFQVNRPGVIIEAIKRAEKEDATIVRLYEAHNTRGRFTLKTSLPFKQVFLADLMERTLSPLPFKNGEVEYHVKPFEIVTLRFV